MVATAGILSYEMTVPGGGSLPCGGVTRVSVRSTHRRRGLLTAMMRRQLNDMHERGEPLAALYASEAPIYGRFGYGLATYQTGLDIDRSRGTFAKPVATSGALEMVDVPTAVKLFGEVWEKARPHQPGMLTLGDGWWRYLLADLETHREGASPHYRVIYRAGERPTGFVLYRIKMGWEASVPYGNLRVEFLIAANAEAYAALWRHVLDVDLISKVSASMRRVDEPLYFLLADPRQRASLEDGLWLRLVDVARALAGRRYAVDDRVVLRVRDGFCPWNQGHFELNGGPSASQCQTCNDEPDLEVDVADLAAVYLGGNRFEVLQEAGRALELRPGGIAKADRMFATDRVPWCPSHF